MRYTRTLLPRPIQAGFTLVELLIVVIILSVLAAIIVPQFTSATIDAKEAALDANLARLRSAVELFRAQHNNIYPGAAPSSGATCPAGTAGTATTANTAQAMLDHMLMYSNPAGQTCSIASGAFKYGPYLRKFPNDPIRNNGAIDMKTTGAPLAPSADIGGWQYDTQSGEIVMNSNANDSTGSRKYSAH